MGHFITRCGTIARLNWKTIKQIIQLWITNLKDIKYRLFQQEKKNFCPERPPQIQYLYTAIQSSNHYLSRQTKIPMKNKWKKKSSLFTRGVQTNPYPPVMRHGEIRQLHGLISSGRIGVLQRVESLHQADDSVAGFGKGVLFWVFMLALGMIKNGERNRLRPRQIRGPPLKGRYSHPLLAFSSHRSGRKEWASGP